MTDFTEQLRSLPARLVNIRWGFASDWVPLRWAVAQFEAHRAELQDGLVLEWSEGPGSIKRLNPDEVRRAFLCADDNPSTAVDRAG